MKELYLDFYGVTAKVSGKEDILQILALDFEYFHSKTLGYVDFSFSLSLSQPDFSKLKNLKASKQSFNSVTFDKKEIRYNDYYGKALTTYNYLTDDACIESEDIDLLHETAYLMILSRVGKKLDDRGYHKVHAMGVGYKKCALMLMMPMKGGKSTLFIDLLKKEDVSIISDDCPLIKNGKIYPFPLRVGVSNPERLPEGNKDLLYSIKRSSYGKKDLAPLTYFKNSVETKFEKLLICEGVRVYNNEAKVLKRNWLFGMRALSRHMIIGVGLPMIIEYFIENSIKDHFLNLRIFFKRLSQAFVLLLQSDVYEVQLGLDREKNAQVLYSFLREST